MKDRQSFECIKSIKTHEIISFNTELGTVDVRWGYENIKGLKPVEFCFYRNGVLSEDLIKFEASHNNMDATLLKEAALNCSDKMYFVGGRFEGTGRYDICFVDSHEVFDDHVCPSCIGGFSITEHFGSRKNTFEMVDGIPLLKAKSAAVPRRFVYWNHYHNTLGDMIPGSVMNYKGVEYHALSHSRHMYNHEHLHLIPTSSVRLSEKLFDLNTMVMPTLAFIQLHSIERWFREARFSDGVLKFREHSPLLHPSVNSLDCLDGEDLGKVSIALISMVLINQVGTAPSVVYSNGEIQYNILMEYIAASPFGKKIVALLNGYPNMLDGVNLLLKRLDKFCNQWIQSYPAEHLAIDLAAETVVSSEHRLVMSIEPVGTAMFSDDVLIAAKKIQKTIVKNGKQFETYTLPHWDKLVRFHELWENQIIRKVDSVSAKESKSGGMKYELHSNVSWVSCEVILELPRDFVYVKLSELLENCGYETRAILLLLRDRFKRNNNIDDGVEKGESVKSAVKKVNKKNKSGKKKKGRAAKVEAPVPNSEPVVENNTTKTKWKKVTDGGKKVNEGVPDAKSNTPNVTNDNPTVRKSSVKKKPGNNSRLKKNTVKFEFSDESVVDKTSTHNVRRALNGVRNERVRKEEVEQQGRTNDDHDLRSKVESLEKQLIEQREFHRAENNAHAARIDELSTMLNSSHTAMMVLFKRLEEKEVADRKAQ